MFFTTGDPENGLGGTPGVIPAETVSGISEITFEVLNEQIESNKGTLSGGSWDQGVPLAVHSNIGPLVRAPYGGVPGVAAPVAGEANSKHYRQAKNYKR